MCRSAKFEMHVTIPTIGLHAQDPLVLVSPGSAVGVSIAASNKSITDQHIDILCLVPWSADYITLFTHSIETVNMYCLSGKSSSCSQIALFVFTFNHKVNATVNTCNMLTEINGGVKLG